MSSALEERWTPDQILGVARELLYECWTHSQDCVHDNLYKGRLGAYWLLYELSRVDVPASASIPISASVEESRGAVSVYRHKRPLQQARDGAYQVVVSLPTVWSEHEAKFHYQAETSLALLQSDWMGAHCFLCACEHRLQNSVAAKKILATIHQRLVVAVTAHQHHDQHHDHVHHPRGDPSVMKGTAGILQAILWLRRELEMPTLFQNVLVDLAVQLITEGRQTQEVTLFWPVPPVIQSSKAKANTKNRPEKTSSLDLGASRGTVGILFTLLGCSPTDWTIINDKLPCHDDGNGQGQAKQWIQNTINQLVMQVEEAMAKQHDHDFLNKFDWAHGACGYILLLLHAAQVFHEQSYLQQAYQLCEWMWDRPHQWSRRLGLAFGSSTMAICFLQLSKVCPKPTNLLWQRRAEFVLQTLMRDYKENLTFYGLYDGLGGLVSAILQLHHKVVIEVPLFCHGHGSSLHDPPLLWQPNSEDDDNDNALLVTTKPSSPLKPEPTLQPLPARSISVETSAEPRPSRSPAYTPLIVSAKNTTRSHFSAENSNEQAFFWSLQTQSHIGSAEAYKPALIETTTIEHGDTINHHDLAGKTSQVPSTVPPVDRVISAPAGTSTTPQLHHDETLPSHPPVGEQDHQQQDEDQPNPVVVIERKIPEDSPSSPPLASRAPPVKTTLSQRKPRPIPIEIHTPSTERPRASNNILGGKVRLTRAAQLRMERMQKEATGDAQPSTTALSAAPLPTSNRHSRTTTASSTTSSRDSSMEPPCSSTATSLEERSRLRRDDARRRVEHLERIKGMAITTQSSNFHAEEKARIQKAKELREQTEQQNRLRVQQQAKERAQRIALQKAQQNIAKEVARKKKEGEKARLERAKVIRQQLEAANRAKVEMQTQWKLERIAKKNQEEMVKREAMRVEKVELAKQAMLHRHEDRRRIEESHAKILIQQLEKVKAVENATSGSDAKTLRHQPERLESVARKRILESPLSSSVPSGPNTSPGLVQQESEIKDCLPTGNSDKSPKADLPISVPSPSQASILDANPDSNTADKNFETTSASLLELSPIPNVPADPSPSHVGLDDTATSLLPNIGRQTLDYESGVESTDTAVTHPGNTLESPLVLANNPPSEAVFHSVIQNSPCQSYGPDDMIHPNESATESVTGSTQEMQERPVESYETGKVSENGQNSGFEECVDVDAEASPSRPDEATTNQMVELAGIGDVELSPAFTRRSESDAYTEQLERGTEFSQEATTSQSPNQRNTGIPDTVDSSGFEYIDAIFENVENALETELGLILDPLPTNESLGDSNETIPFEDNKAITSTQCGEGSAQATLGPSEIDSRHTNSTQRLPSECLDEVVGGSLESKEHASDKGAVTANDPKFWINDAVDVQPIGDSRVPPDQTDLETNPISACSSSQQGNEEGQTFPPDMPCSTPIHKSSAIGIGPDNSGEPHSKEIEVVQHEKPLPFDGPTVSFLSDALRSETLASPVFPEAESNRVSKGDLTIVQVEGSEDNDTSAEHAETGTFEQRFTESVDVASRFLGNDDPSIIQSVSPDGASNDDFGGSGTEPKECGLSLAMISNHSSDEPLIQSVCDVNAHVSSREDTLSPPFDNETQRQEPSSPMMYLSNDGDNHGENVITTSWSSEPPDGFDELDQLFKEAESQLETELAATLAISGSTESNTKHDPSIAPRKPTTPVSVSSLKVSMLSRRKVAAASADAQSSTTTQAPGSKWIERLHTSKNKAD